MPLGSAKGLMPCFSGFMSASSYPVATNDAHHQLEAEERLCQAIDPGVKVPYAGSRILYRPVSRWGVTARRACTPRNCRTTSEHGIPLLPVVRAEGIVGRLFYKHPLEPLLRRLPLWDVGRMNVKTFCRAGKHSCCCPLPGPEADVREQAILLPRKLTEKAAVPLRVNLPCKEFHTRDPCLGKRSTVRGNQFARIHTRRAESLR